MKTIHILINIGIFFIIIIVVTVVIPETERTIWEQNQLPVDIGEEITGRFPVAVVVCLMWASLYCLIYSLHFMSSGA